MLLQQAQPLSRVFLFRSDEYCNMPCRNVLPNGSL